MQHGQVDMVSRWQPPQRRAAMSATKSGRTSKRFARMTTYHFMSLLPLQRLTGGSVTEAGYSH